MIDWSDVFGACIGFRGDEVKVFDTVVGLI